MESWDVFPSKWEKLRDDAEINRDGYASGLCGRYFNRRGNVKAARRALNRLATRGIKILAAIRDEKKKGATPDLTETGYVGLGYRSFLGAMRHTAETYRHAILNVEHRRWGFRRQGVQAMGDTLGRFHARRARAIEKGQTPPLGLNVIEVIPGIFLACANAIRLWLEAAPPNPMFEHAMYDIQPIRLPATDSPDNALRLMGITPSPGVKAAAPPKKRGRPRVSAEEQAEDLRLYNLKQKPEYLRWKDLARDETLTKDDRRPRTEKSIIAELKRRVGRARKRLASMVSGLAGIPSDSTW